MTTITVPNVRVAAANPGTRFFFRMSVVCLAVGVVGFAPTYWIPLTRGTLAVSPITHLHALLFYGWLLLFVSQSWLAGSRRIARHREMGVLGVALASGMCFVGTGTAIQSLERAIDAGFADAGRAFSIVPVSGIAFFAVLFALAVINTRRPDVHKRLILVATVSMLQAAVGRWFILFLAPARPAGDAGVSSPPPVFVTVMPALTVDLLIVAAMVHDFRSRGRVHRVYWIAAGAMVAVQMLRVPLSTTAAWTQVTSWLLAIAP